MNRLHMASLLSVVASIAILAPLTGCGLGAAFPNASVNRGQVSVGSIQGSNFGGHAPLVASHIYLLEAGDSGYGTPLPPRCSPAPTPAASPRRRTPATPASPRGWYYETTDATGAFNLTGDYTCTSGDLVYLYAYGGSPSFPNPHQYLQRQLRQHHRIVCPVHRHLHHHLHRTGLYRRAGQLLGPPSTDGLSTLNSGTYSVVSANLTTNTFAVQPSSGITGTGTPATSGVTATLLPAFNPGVVNLAVLGVCPDSGSLQHRRHALQRCDIYADPIRLHQRGLHGRGCLCAPGLCLEQQQLRRLHRHFARHLRHHRILHRQPDRARKRRA